MPDKNTALTAKSKNGTNVLQGCGKYSEYYPKRQVRTLFLSGNRYTAREINRIVGFNDARKVISDLRHKDNWNIKDVRLDSGCKLYWLEPDGQPTLFAKGADDE